MRVPTRGADGRRILVVVVALVVATGLSSCHPLINPVDPRAVNYTGAPAADGSGGGGNGDTPAPVLPTSVRWEFVTDHSPGRLLPLEITDDGSFVEPRDAGWYDLWITLSDSFERQQADGAQLWIAVSFSGGPPYYSAVGLDPIPEQRRLVVNFGSIPNVTLSRLRLTDRNGIVIGERVLGRLIGDVDGDGTVSAAVDAAALSKFDGFTVSTDNPDTIRSDLDLDGVVDETAGGDGGLITVHDTETLPATPPDFWD